MKSRSVLFFSLFIVTGSALAGIVEVNGKILSKIRVVGDYPGITYDNSVEL